MDALLLVAHGSRRHQSNLELEHLLQQIAAQGGGAYGHYALAFLEMAEPSVEQGVRACVAAGAHRITLTPCFLAAGSHVTRDVPAVVESMARLFPEVLFRVAPHLGTSPLLAEAVLECARRAAGEGASDST